MPFRLVFWVRDCTINNKCISCVLFGQRDRSLHQVCIQTRCKADMVTVRAEVFHYLSLNQNSDVVFQNGLALVLRDDFIKLGINGLRVVGMAVCLVQILTKSFEPGLIINNKHFFPPLTFWYLGVRQFSVSKFNLLLT